MESPYKSGTGVLRVLNALRCAFAGLAAAARHEEAFRLELLACALLLPLAFRLDATAVERALLVASLLVVLIVELVNSAIETAVDRVSLELHPLAKRAKDIGAAAVMLSLVSAGVVWLIVLTA